jgi:Xaa-Pro aminopeptidase
MSGTSRPEPIYNATELLRMYDELGLDAVIARSGRNVAYLAGMRFPGTLGRLQDFAHAPRAVLAVMPRDADGALVASNIAAGLARRTTWLEDIRTYTEYSQSPFEVAAQVLADRGLAAGRIGVERREIGVQQWDDLVAALPGAELVDCTDALESVRNIKTPAELELLRNAARIQDEAHLEVFGSARPGETERTLHARMVGAMLRLGAESAHGMLQSSKTPMTYGGEGDVPIEAGDAVRTDYVCYVEGYAANLSRMATMGAPSAEQERMYGLVRDVHRETITRVLRPGVEARDVYAFVRDRFVAAGFPKVSGLVGHSIGVWWHQEEPMLVPSESRVLRPNMVVCLEPILDGFWHLQDEILITDGEPELLSHLFNTDSIFVMGD